MPKNVAVFVDGDNIGKSNASKILSLAKSHGSVILARCYGRQESIAGWAETPGFQFFLAGNGKNAADIQIALDSTEFALTKQVDVIVLCSSDSDFAPIAHRLREFSKEVVGCGHEKAPPVFRSACTKFNVLRANFKAARVPNADTNAAPQSSKEIPKASSATDLDHKIKKVIAANSTQGRGMKIADLNPIMNRQHNTKISNHDDKTWRGYLSKRPSLYDLDPKGPEAKVRFKPNGFEPAP